MTKNDTMGVFAEYIAASATSEPPAEVEAAAIRHITDTVAATVSGSQLPAGEAGARFARRLGGRSMARVLGTDLTTDVITAALANGMSAHADETDDSHEESLSHPGCAVIPAALSIAESRQLSGRQFIRAVIVGYDCGTRVGMALGHPEKPLEGSSHSSHAYAGVYGAAAAGASALRFSAEQARYVMSYAAQSAAGTTSWARDPNHVEKAFVFGGMPASNGVRAAEVVSDGWDGVADVFHGQPNALDAVVDSPRRERLVEGLGEVYSITRTNIKKFAVGSPSQAAIQAVIDLMAGVPFETDEIERVEIVIPHDLAQVVDDRELPNINVQFLVAGTLVDRKFSFAMAHNFRRMNEPQVLRLRQLTELVHDRSVTGRRQATVKITLADGRSFEQFVPSVRGTIDDPMSAEEVEEKARDLMEPVLGSSRTDRVLDHLRNLQDVTDVGELGRLCQLP